MRFARNRSGFTLYETVAAVGLAAAAVLLAAVAGRALLGAVRVRADHTRIREAYEALRVCRVSCSSPADGSSLGGPGPYAFYFLDDGTFAPEGSHEADRVPAGAFVLAGSDGSGGGCAVDGPGTIVPGHTDPAALPAGSFVFCGEHLRGNRIRVVCLPGASAEEAVWLLELC